MKMSWLFQCQWRKNVCLLSFLFCQMSFSAVCCATSFSQIHLGGIELLYSKGLVSKVPSSNPHRSHLFFLSFFLKYILIYSLWDILNKLTKYLYLNQISFLLGYVLIYMANWNARDSALEGASLGWRSLKNSLWRTVRAFSKEKYQDNNTIAHSIVSPFSTGYEPGGRLSDTCTSFLVIF